MQLAVCLLIHPTISGNSRSTYFQCLLGHLRIRLLVLYFQYTCLILWSERSGKMSYRIVRRSVCHQLLDKSSLTCISCHFLPFSRMRSILMTSSFIHSFRVLGCSWLEELFGLFNELSAFLFTCSGEVHLCVRIDSSIASLSLFFLRRVHGLLFGASGRGRRLASRA